MKFLLSESKQYLVTTFDEVKFLIDHLRKKYKGNLKEYSITTKTDGKKIKFYIIKAVIEYYKISE